MSKNNVFEESWKDALRHRGFAVKSAKDHMRKSHIFDVDDLVDEGLIVLFEASRKHGLLKPAYARTCLRHGLCKAIIERGRTTRVPWGSFKENATGARAAASARFWGSASLLLLMDQLIIDADPSIRLEKQELTEHIINALDTLDPRSRSVIFQLYWEERSGRQIAHTLGCTRQNVSYISKQALKKLRNHIIIEGRRP